MKLWAAFYLIIWIVVVEFVLAMTPQAQPFLSYVHAGLGLLIVLITYWNFEAVRSTTAPARIKRIARITFQLSIVMVFFGFLLLVNVGASWVLVGGLTLWDGIIFLHLLLALAIITQAASTATAYDMWEEKELFEATRPAEIPAPPIPRGDGRASRPVVDTASGPTAPPTS
jgi:hypothetical protein